jgi:hypothetical protein
MLTRLLHIFAQGIWSIPVQRLFFELEREWVTPTGNRQRLLD